MIPNNPTAEQMDKAMDIESLRKQWKDKAMEIESLRKQWKAKQITYNQIPLELRQAVTGRSPIKAVTK